MIPILLFAALDTCAFAATTGNARPVAVAHSDHERTRLGPGIASRTGTGTGVGSAVVGSAVVGSAVIANDEQQSRSSSSSFLNWYDSETVHSIRLVLAGALGFLLVLLGIHVLLPSTAGRHANDPKSLSGSTNGCGCPSGQHATQGNDRLGQNQCGGANVGNFLPLGISLNHLNAIGQQMHGQSGNESKQYDELTDKIVALENSLRQLSGGVSKPLHPIDTSARSESSAGQGSRDADVTSVESNVDSYSCSDISDGLQTDQQNENVRSHSHLKSHQKPEQNPIFESLISETLAVIHSQ